MIPPPEHNSFGVHEGVSWIPNTPSTWETENLTLDLSVWESCWTSGCRCLLSSWICGSSGMWAISRAQRGGGIAGSLALTGVLSFQVLALANSSCGSIHRGLLVSWVLFLLVYLLLRNIFLLGKVKSMVLLSCWEVRTWDFDGQRKTEFTSWSNLCHLASHIVPSTFWHHPRHPVEGIQQVVGRLRTSSWPIITNGSCARVLWLGLTFAVF